MPRRRQAPPSQSLANLLGVDTAIPKSGGERRAQCYRHPDLAARWEVKFDDPAGSHNVRQVCGDCRQSISMNMLNSNYQERRRKG